LKQPAFRNAEADHLGVALPEDFDRSSERFF
jgi:hypothetical protein